MDEKIIAMINKARQEMKEMLLSVSQFNFSFRLNENQKNLLGKIIEAMIKIDRKYFVSSFNAKYCYDDNALPLGKGQTISQPSTVARMLILIEFEKDDDVLEVGAGSGWNSALIAYLIEPGKVTTADRINSLVDTAKNNIDKLGKAIGKSFLNLTLVTEDALNEKSIIWQKRYDKIVITAGIPHSDAEERIKKMAENLLKKKGILICPYTSGPFVIYKKDEQQRLKKEYTKEHYVFVPLLEGVEK